MKNQLLFLKAVILLMLSGCVSLYNGNTSNPFYSNMRVVPNKHKKTNSLCKLPQK